MYYIIDNQGTVHAESQSINKIDSYLMNIMNSMTEQEFKDKEFEIIDDN